MACCLMAPSHYVLRCWFIVNLTLGNKFYRNLKQSMKLSFNREQYIHFNMSSEKHQPYSLDLNVLTYSGLKKILVILETQFWVPFHGSNPSCTHWNTVQICSNYINLICWVATICHQVRCMYWGHLGNFHRAISHLRWYKIVCIRYLACTFSQMKSINMFSMFLQSGVPRHYLWRFIAVWIYNLTVFMFMYVDVDLKL